MHATSRSARLLFLFFFLLSATCLCDDKFDEFDEDDDDDDDDDEDEEDDGRVVGGDVTTIDNHPYQVSLRFRGSHTCGGAILSNKWIVTAAHCVQSKPRQMLSIKAGSSTLRGRSGHVYRIREVIVHEDYSPLSSDSDIALVRVAGSLQMSDRVQPIEMDSSDEPSGEALVVGWGLLEEDGEEVSNDLREVSVPVISRSECSKLYPDRSITERMICAGYVGEGGRDACQGDSGGPLVQDYRLLGIVSWGIGCADPHYPGVYTKISAFRSWIEDNAS